MVQTRCVRLYGETVTKELALDGKIGSRLADICKQARQLVIVLSRSYGFDPEEYLPGILRVAPTADREVYSVLGHLIDRVATDPLNYVTKNGDFIA